MPFTKFLIKAIKKDFPQLKFKEASMCRWSPSEKTVYHTPLRSADDSFMLLHELAHACLEHHDYTNDSELLAKEVEAWDYAKTVLSKHYRMSISEEFIESSLDTYRIWLHNRSLCPQCNQNGLQTKNDTYECINCRCRWRVNDARQCQLKRYRVVSDK